MKQEVNVATVLKGPKVEVSGRDICTPERQEKAEMLYRERVARSSVRIPQKKRNIYSRFIFNALASLGIKSGHKN